MLEIWEEIESTAPNDVH